MPDGYTVKFNGADYEQLIAADGTVNHPLVDKTVQVAYVVTDTATGNTKTTSDIPYVVKGTNQQQEGNNAKPTIIPEIAEWHSTSAAKLAASAVTRSSTTMIRSRPWSTSSSPTTRTSPASS